MSFQEGQWWPWEKLFQGRNWYLHELWTAWHNKNANLCWCHEGLVCAVTWHWIKTGETAHPLADCLLCPISTTWISRLRVLLVTWKAQKEFLMSWETATAGNQDISKALNLLYFLFVRFNFMAFEFRIFHTLLSCALQHVLHKERTEAISSERVQRMDLMTMGFPAWIYCCDTGETADCGNHRITLARLSQSARLP